MHESRRVQARAGRYARLGVEESLALKNPANLLEGGADLSCWESDLAQSLDVGELGAIFF
jgi:hypothetical protein